MKYFGFKCNVWHTFCTADRRLHMMRCNSTKVMTARTDVYTAGLIRWNKTCTGLRDGTDITHISIMLRTFWCKLQMITKTAYLYTNKWQFIVFSLCPAHTVLMKTNSHMQFHKNVLLGSVHITNECDSDIATTITTNKNNNILRPVTCNTFSVSAVFQPFASDQTFILKSVLAHFYFLFFMHVASIYSNNFVNISGMKNLDFLRLFYHSPLSQYDSFM